jgi:hypothetical protein
MKDGWTPSPPTQTPREVIMETNLQVPCAGDRLGVQRFGRRGAATSDHEQLDSLRSIREDVLWYCGTPRTAASGYSNHKALVTKPSKGKEQTIPRRHDGRENAQRTEAILEYSI